MIGYFDSGPQAMNHRRRTVEEGYTLGMPDLSRPARQSCSSSGFLRAVKIEDRRTLRVRWALEHQSAEEAPTLLLLLFYSPTRMGNEEEVNQRVSLITTQPNFGGMRHWFSCPWLVDGKPCGRRVSKLYLPPAEDRFGCRECHKLTYRSSQRSHHCDRICRLMSAGVPEVEETLKRAFALQDRRARKQTLEAPPRSTLAEVFDEVFGGEE